MVAYLLFIYITFTYVRNYFRFRNVPGPFVARFSNLWRLWSVYKRRPHEVQVDLHARHGDVVLLGPDCVSVSGPDYVALIYGIGKGFVKVGKAFDLMLLPLTL